MASAAYLHCCFFLLAASLLWFLLHGLPFELSREVRSPLLGVFCLFESTLCYICGISIRANINIAVKGYFELVGWDCKAAGSICVWLLQVTISFAVRVRIGPIEQNIWVCNISTLFG
jgi:hypothetical protein